MIDYTKLRKKLIPEPDGEPPVVMRTGTVDAVNSDGTVDVEMSSGVILPDIPRLASADVAVGMVVNIISFRGSLLVIGPSAQQGSAPVASGGRIATTVRTSNSSAVGGVETVSDSVTAYLINGSTYRVRWTAAFDTSVNGNTAFSKIREDSVSGTSLQIERITLPLTGGSGSRYPGHVEVEYTAVATGNKTFVSTYLLGSGSGTVNVAAASNFPVYLYVDFVR